MRVAQMKKLMLFALLLFGISLFSSNHTMAAESRITVPFEKEMKINWNWNDFKKSSIKGPSTNLAIAGLILSGNAEEKGYGKYPYSKVEETLKALGFQNTEHSYYSKDQKNYPGMSFGMSSVKVNNKTVVVAVYRGTVNNKDVATDISSQFGDGFQTAGKNGKARLEKYLRDHKLTKKNTILYLVGHSYGAAAACQVALNCNDLAAKTSTFVYLYATPNNYVNGTSTTDHYNIYNYINVDDGVPYVPKRIDCGKRGNIISYDYGKQMNVPSGASRKTRFELGYYLLRGKMFSNDKSLWRDHLTYNYMAFLLSDLSTEEILAHFSVVPKMSSVKSNKAETAVIRWEKTGNPDGYEIYMAGSKKGTYKNIATIKGKGNLSYTKTGLTGGKKYYFKVCAYYQIGNRKIRTAQSAAGSVTVKKQKITVKLNKKSLKLKVGAKASLKATKTGTKKPLKWSSSDKRIATVSQKGEITGKKAGTATITAKVGKVKAKCKVTVENNNDWKKLYGDFLAIDLHRDQWTYRVGEFALYDLNKDGVPELFTHGGGRMDYTKIFTVRKGKVACVGWSTNYTIYSNNMVLAYFNAGAGYGLYSYYSVKSSLNFDLKYRYADWFFESVYREGEKASEKTAPAVTEDSVRAKVQRLMGTAKTVTVNYYSNTADNRKKYIK